MKRILCSHAGRHGDILWALPTVRAIAETVGEPVDLMLAGKYAGIAGFLEKHAGYIGKCFGDETWEVVETAPMTPAMPPRFAEAGLERVVEPLEPSGVRAEDYSRVIHLSFKGWPMSKTLAEGYWQTVKEEHFPGELGPVGGVELKELELERPWIEGVKPAGGVSVAAGFSDEWFELKYGLVELLHSRFHVTVCCAPGSRWDREGLCPPSSWEGMAEEIAGAEVFLGCLSAAWCLANALGKRCVIMEPSEPRHHPVFWRDSPRNVLVRGNDGKPTFDARHVVDALFEVLQVERAERLAQMVGRRQ